MIDWVMKLEELRRVCQAYLYGVHKALNTFTIQLYILGFGIKPKQFQQNHE